MKPEQCRKNKAFTLIELLVVITILGILMSLMLPVMGRSKEKARAMVKYLNNRQQLMTLCSGFEDNKNDPPLLVSLDFDGTSISNSDLFLLQELLKSEFFKLQPMPQMDYFRSLSFRDTAFQDSWLANFVMAPNLEVLYLDNTGLTDAGLLVIQNNCKRLIELTITQCKALTPAAIAAYKTAMPACVVQHD